MQVVQRANQSCYGLAAGVFTKNLDLANYLSRALRAGTVWINTFDNFDASIPFGGYKMSGVGREHGMYALENFTQVSHPPALTCSTLANMGTVDSLYSGLYSGVCQESDGCSVWQIWNQYLEAPCYPQLLLATLLSRQGLRVHKSCDCGQEGMHLAMALIIPKAHNAFLYSDNMDDSTGISM